MSRRELFINNLFIESVSLEPVRRKMVTWSQRRRLFVPTILIIMKGFNLFLDDSITHTFTRRLVLFDLFIISRSWLHDFVLFFLLICPLTRLNALSLTEVYQ